MLRCRVHTPPPLQDYASHTKTFGNYQIFMVKIFFAIFVNSQLENFCHKFFLKAAVSIEFFTFKQ